MPGYNLVTRADKRLSRRLVIPTTAHPLLEYDYKNACMVLIACLVLMLYGCGVSTEVHNALLAKHKNLTKENSVLNGNNRMLQNKISTILAEKESLNTVLSKKSSDLSNRYAELRSSSEKLSSAYEQLNSTSQELTNRQLELESTNEKLNATSSKLSEKEQALAKTQAELATTTNYIKNTNKLYDELVNELKGELANNEIKIKELKDGINLNLADNILFSSGSANLNKKGIIVLKKVSGQLQSNKYQIIVSGFTDDIPIRGSLAKRFPTNWELAAARASSVVKLLEETGIDSDKLMAVSFGENKPIVANDSPEGRATNRRIEIQLKPIR